ncbi:hypothetical protein HZA97_00240 [Candidatus Woesearchaeota archaeon]|nr:hypothetical protein [Candidatus Woesearchaeota archaeon]
MTKQDYVTALEELRKGVTDINIIREALPHITKREIQNYLNASKKGIETVVCAPPTVVQDAAWFISFAPEEVDRRTGEVFPQGVFSVGVTSDKSQPCFDLAQKYAKKAWGEDLKPITWKDFVHFHFDNPKKINAQGKPTCVGDVYLAIKEEFKRLNLDVSKTLSELLDSSIVEITNNFVVATEIGVSCDVNPMTYMTNNY